MSLFSASNRRSRGTNSVSFKPAIYSPVGHLLVLMRPRLGLSMATEWPVGELSLDSMIFTDTKGWGSWIGFYDWLRGPSGQLLGVRLCLNKDTKPAFEFARQYSYTHLNAALEIFFGSDREVNWDESNDQDLLCSQALFSKTGECVLCFAMDEMSREEWESLLKATADWVTFSIK